MNDIVITGGFGFIGSNLIEFLNKKGIVPSIISPVNRNWRNVVGLKFRIIRDTEIRQDSIIVHLGANVDTTEEMNSILWDNNVNYTIKLLNSIPHKKFIYASSAAVYGKEDKNFVERIGGLKPLNAYGFTKWYLDNFIFTDRVYPNLSIYGLRFFNVYGPREDYKYNMASVVHKALVKNEELYNSSNLDSNPVWNLFKSYKAKIPDGEQKRDFVYVEDVCNMIWFFINNSPENGIYNIGSGKATSFNQLIKAIDSRAQIEYIEMPSNLKKQYQYYTCANLTKLSKAGFDINQMHTIEEGIQKTKEYILGNE